jgi:hypothetical protein
MSDIDTLENTVKKPVRAKKPSNFALWGAYAFFNTAVLLFDGIAASTVYSITNNWGYAIATFLAGFVPLLLHEFLFLRAYANRTQRGIAIGGAVLSVITVAIVAFVSAGLNIALANGYQIDGQAGEYVVLFVIVAAVLVHGILTAIYFYSDEGIKAIHTAQENEAYHAQRLKNLERAGELLESADKARSKKQAIINKYGNKDDAKRALKALLEQFGDEDGDGIPDNRDPIDNRTGKPFTRPQEAPKQAQMVALAKDVPAEQLDAPNAQRGGKQ